MKKIVYLMEYPIDLPGGAQMSTLSICEALSGDARYEPVVICPELIRHRKEDYPFRVLEYPMGTGRIRNLFIRIKAFSRYIAEERPDLIHIEMSESLITYGFIRKKFRDIKYIYTDRGLLFGYRQRSRLFMFPVLRDSDMLITTTEFNKELWTEGTDIRPIEVIPNTISSKFFGTYDETKRKTGKKFTVGLAGRICVEKDWPFAVEFVKALHDTGLDFRVDIVLSTYEKGDAEKVASIEKELRDTVGDENLELHTEYDQQQMSDFYYDVDVFLMTSQFESFGKAAVEAMSRRCAIVSTAVGGLPEVVGMEENLYDKADFKKGVRCVKMLADDPAKLAEEQDYFYRRYREKYTEEKYTEAHRRIYDELI